MQRYCSSPFTALQARRCLSTVCLCKMVVLHILLESHPTFSCRLTCLIPRLEYLRFLDVRYLEDLVHHDSITSLFYLKDNIARHMRNTPHYTLFLTTEADMLPAGSKQWRSVYWICFINKKLTNFLWVFVFALLCYV